MAMQRRPASTGPVLAFLLASVSALVLTLAPGLATAMPCGPEEDTTVRDAYTGVYDAECYGDCDAPQWKLSLEAVSGPDGVWYEARFERGGEVTVLGGVMPGGPSPDSMPNPEWDMSGKSQLEKLGAAVAVSWIGMQMGMPGLKLGGWVPPGETGGGGQGGGEIDGGQQGGGENANGAVPEPTAALLFGAGFGIAAIRRRAT